jgi:hypothetical protein
MVHAARYDPGMRNERSTIRGKRFAVGLATALMLGCLPPNLAAQAAAPRFIFNASETAVRNRARPTETMLMQIAGIDALFSEIRSRSPRAELYLVINGGTSSQRWWGSTLLAGDNAALWKPLQEKYGVRYLWRMNLNQTDEAERDLLRQIERHIDIYMVIFGAEPYLLKHLKPRSDGSWPDEVGALQRGITGDSYMERATRCVELFGRERRYGFMLAPERQGSDTAFGKRAEEWNAALIPALRSLAERGVAAHACVHIYRRGAYWDVAAFLRRTQLALGDIPIWITESGAASDGENDLPTADSPELIAAELELYRDMCSALRPIDVIGSHSAWKPPHGNLAQAWHDGSSLTPRGRALVEAAFGE